MGLSNFQLYRDTNKLPSSWDELAHHDIFLKKSFLAALEASSPQNISSFFLGVYKNDTLVAIAVIQRVEVYYEDIFRKSNVSFWANLGKRLVSKIVRGNALVVGNLMHTGHHGFAYDPNLIHMREFLETIKQALSTIENIVKNDFGKKIRIIAFKDYFEDNPIHDQSDFFETNKFYKVRVQPNMIFELPKDWKSPNDYIASFNKKYRRRYKTALKKKQPIQVKELSLDAISTHQERLFELYENVSDNAKVNSFKLDKAHFYHLKAQLNDDFKLFAYVLKEEIVGFFTLILNVKEVETYFLGYEPALQHPHQMYLNMLFDMASFGINHGFERVVFARTAMEIKSSVGAKPQEMSIYLKHTNNLLANSILKFIVKYMNPIRQWEERHPFSE